MPLFGAYFLYNYFMIIEDKIFKKHSADFNKLKRYGFIEKNKEFLIEKTFFNDEFRMVLKIDKNSKVQGKVFDVENNDEFLPLRIENNEGAYVAAVKEEYKKLLEDIKDKCFIKRYFIYPQSNRITNKIIEKYNSMPEFLWEKYDDTGIFRNKNTQKWYGIIMDVDRSKIQENKKGLIEVLNVKLEPNKIEKLLQENNFYKAYHMNKKYWLSVILDDSVEDDIIMNLIDESYILSNKGKRNGK